MWTSPDSGHLINCWVHERSSTNTCLLGSVEMPLIRPRGPNVGGLVYLATRRKSFPVYDDSSVFLYQNWPPVFEIQDMRSVIVLGVLVSVAAAIALQSPVGRTSLLDRSASISSGCSTSGPTSCHNTSPVSDTCCFESPGVCISESSLPSNYKRN